MKTKDVLFVIKIDTSLYDEAEHCTLAMKVEDLTGKANIPLLSTQSVKRESCLEKAAKCRTFCFNTSFAGTHLTAEQDNYETSYQLSSVPKARQWK